MGSTVVSVEAWVRDLFISGPPHWMVPNKSMRSLSVNSECEAKRRKTHQDVKTIEEERKTEIPEAERCHCSCWGPEVMARWLLVEQLEGLAAQVGPCLAPHEAC